MKAYLLAAGRGRRAGGPKAWLESEGSTLLERQLAFLLKRFPAEAVHVSIQAEWLDRCRALNPSVNWVAADPDAAAFDSLQRIVKAAKPGWAFLHHVDMPVWEDGLFSALKNRAAAACGAEAVVPTHEGRRGHPVILSPRLQREIAKRDPATARLDEMLRQARVEELDVPFACVLENRNEA